MTLKFCFCLLLFVYFMCFISCFFCSLPRDIRNLRGGKNGNFDKSNS